jgi:PKD repeat protein
VREALYNATTKGIVTSSNTANNHLLFDLYSGSASPNQPPAAGFTFTTAGLTATFTDTSTDSDGTVTGWNWDFGDDSTPATTRHPTHPYASSGTYVVTQVATDNDGATASVSKNVTVNSGAITLAATWRKVGAVYSGDLTWTGAVGGSVDVYRNGLKIITTVNDGAHTDKIGKKAGSYTYEVCEAGTKTCPNPATIDF